jgi:hypothetical protein
MKIDRTIAALSLVLGGGYILVSLTFVAALSRHAVWYVREVLGRMSGTEGDFKSLLEYCESITVLRNNYAMAMHVAIGIIVMFVVYFLMEWLGGGGRPKNR